MSVAAAPATSAPTPADCDHPAPVTGVMAHEFAPREGALGPEGTRRTTTYYGPTMGGLPILAWHCERCGLLRLTYPDGRREERQLFAGPQPGLLATLVPGDLTDEQREGMQARVSGITVPPELISELLPATEPIRITLPRPPELGAATWITVFFLGVTALGLLVGGYLAVYDYQTPSSLTPIFFTILACFGAAAITPVVAAAQRWIFPMPPLAPGPAHTLRGRPQLGPETTTAVVFLVLTLVALLGGGILAVYDYQTPGALLPLFWGGLVCFGAAVAALLVGAARRLRSGR